MENIFVNLKNENLELKYPYRILKKVEKKEGSMFSLVKPTLENAEKLIKYGLMHTEIEFTEEDIENVAEQLSVEYGMFEMITLLMKRYMYAVNPKINLDEEGKELDEEGLKIVNKVVSGMFGS